MTGKSSEARSPASSGTAPQWSPVEMTGKRGHQIHREGSREEAAMEPGRDDREESARGGS